MKSLWRVGRRCLTRRRCRTTTRRLTNRCGVRRTLRLVVGGRAVNFFSQAMAAFRRAMRAHRRLIKLAPEQFDAAVIDRLAIERAEQAIREAEISAALDKVYGPPKAEDAESDQGQLFFRYGNGMETVWFSKAKRDAVERWQQERELWLEVGRAALERHLKFQPHRDLSMGMVARMWEVGSMLGRLSTGLRPYG